MSVRPHIVVLDGATLNPGDLSWQNLQSLGSLEVYDRTSEDMLVSRAFPANILLVNKVRISAKVLAQLPNLQFIAITATGYNNVDLEACKVRGIRVVNAVGYGSLSVAQHVFALLLELTNRVAWHDRSVKQGDWARCADFSYWKTSIVELAGKTIGIYGFGSIGQQVGKIAQAFGMQVIATHRHPQRDQQEGVRFVDLKTLFAESDVISLNAPLTDDNMDIVDMNLLQTMKPTAYLINTARGGLIVETDLAEALRQKRLAGAALDVLREEPPALDHPLYQIDHCIITPHQAWASQESRQRLMDITLRQIGQFLKGVLREALV
ncbi:MAG: D-2-hydroxyacid dehydrogenase [Saprospiraceae bacterium]|nr:D-2-hydroxyacid dehydrogenase [Saprospiraceae bacterium]